MPEMLTRVKTILVLTLLISNRPSAQVRPVIDTAATDHWPIVNAAAISDDGKYIGYRVLEVPTSNATLYVASTMSTWKFEDRKNVSFNFTNTGHLISLDQDGSLSVKKLGKSDELRTANVRNYKYFVSCKTAWLLVTGKDNSLTLSKIGTRQTYRYSHVGTFYQDRDSKKLLIAIVKGDSTTLELIDLHTMKQQDLGSYKKLNGINFSKTGEYLSFIADSPDKEEKAIWWYKEGLNKPAVILTQHSNKIPSNMSIDRIDHISMDGRYLFFYLTPFPLKKADNEVQVKVWSYEDIRLASDQAISEDPKGPFAMLNRSNDYLACFNFFTHSVVPIQQSKNETCTFYNQREDLLLIELLEGSRHEIMWNSKSRSLYYLFDINTGQRRKLDFRPLALGMSPDGKYLLGRQYMHRNIISYNILEDSLSEIYNIPMRSELANNDQLAPQHAGWEDVHTLIFYDEYDIYTVDLSRNLIPACITNGYGRRNNIIFRFAQGKRESVISASDMNILVAFNNSNKQNGFYKLSKEGDPKLLSMGNQLFYMPDIVTAGSRPIKAINSDTWLLSRERSDSSANLYLTHDFRNFYQVSYNYPEHKYNWLSSELMTYATLDGKEGQAIVYKPENFDASKKYPVIMHYYDRKTVNLNVFLIPERMIGPLNIPWFVSRGYIVCTPDIQYKKGETGASAYNFVYGSAKYISTLNYIDSLNIGLFGHSFGGYETCELITRTGFFKAAVAGAPPTNLVSLVGTIYSSGTNTGAMFTEIGQNRIDYTLWQRPDLYVQNSPLFKADKVTTPLLMMSNEHDGAVPVSQGLEFFIALRRLKKQVWLLQYKDEDHTLGNEENMLDYMRKIEDFYDYLLKGRPKPAWMISIR
jgi:dipeptidyl aminopeptidase/acylaminoacyl peptidase